MDPSQKLLTAITSFEAFTRYVEENSITSIFIGIAVLLSPFIVRAALKLLVQFFYFLGKLFFKDQLLGWMRRKITALLQRFVDKDLSITDTISHQTNMIILYGLEWRRNGVSAVMNKVEIRVDLGATARGYFRNWLKRIWKDFDYELAQKLLFTNSIKDVNVSGVNIVCEVPLPEQECEAELIEVARERAEHAYSKVEHFCRFNLHISMDNVEVLVRVGDEEFRLQNGNVVFENEVKEDGTSSNIRLVFVYDGENISLNSKGGKLEKFRLVASDIYLSGKVWRALQSYYGSLFKDVELQDGKLMDVKAYLAVRDGVPKLEGFEAKADEVTFAWKDHLVEDLEISLVSKNMQDFTLKKLRTTYDDVVYEVRGDICWQDGCISSECIYLRRGFIPFYCRNVRYDLAANDMDWELEPKIKDDAKLFVKETKDRVVEFCEGLKSKFRTKLLTDGR